MAATAPERSPRPRLIFALVVLALAALAVVPVAGAEQGGSQLRRLPFGFLDSGNFHTCVILGGGDVRCWGDRQRRRARVREYDHDIGDNEFPYSVGPVDLGMGRKALAMRSGDVTRARSSNAGAVRCWGYNFDGQLGYGLTDTTSATTSAGARSAPSTSERGGGRPIAAGENHTCAILDNGRVRCWGDGTSGQLGYGNPFTSATTRPRHRRAPSISGPAARRVAITAGGTTRARSSTTAGCAAGASASSGQLGYGNTDSIGDNETPGSVAPVTSAGPDGRRDQRRRAPHLRDPRQRQGALLGLGRRSASSASATRTRSATTSCRRRSPRSTSGPAARAIAVASRLRPTRARSSTPARVRCWGYGGSGQLGYANTNNIGDNELPNAVGPVNLGSGRTARAIAGGSAALVRAPRQRRASAAGARPAAASSDTATRRRSATTRRRTRPARSLLGAIRRNEVAPVALPRAVGRARPRRPRTGSAPRAS